MEGHALAATGATPTLTANRSGCADIIFVVVNIPTFARQARARLQRALPRACQRHVPKPHHNLGRWANRATTSFTLVGTFADFTLSVLIRRG